MYKHTQKEKKNVISGSDIKLEVYPLLIGHLQIRRLIKDITVKTIIGAGHEKTCFMLYAKNKDKDQPEAEQSRPV